VAIDLFAMRVVLRPRSDERNVEGAATSRQNVLLSHALSTVERKRKYLRYEEKVSSMRARRPDGGRAHRHASRFGRNVVAVDG
jgi:hypothetical protein